MALIAQAKDFLAIIRTVQLDELHQQIAQPPLLLVIGADARRAQQFAFALAGAETPDEQAARETTTVATPDVLDGLRVGPEPYDAVLLLDPAPATRQHPVVRHLVTDQRQTAVLEVLTTPGANVDPGIPTVTVTDPTDPAALRPARTRLVPLLHADRRVSWGRTFPGFRKPVTDFLIEQTARANAQFAIMADLGARIPFIGGIAATGADFFVLTKNQLILAYELAAIQGKDLTDQKTAIVSAAPFMIAGLGWRELARAAIRLIPGAPLVPKAVVAYGGTLATGVLARALSNPEGVKAWLKGVEEGTKTSLGVGKSRFAGVKDRLGGLMSGVEERLGEKTHLIPRWQRAPKPGIDLEPPVHVVPAAD